MQQAPADTEALVIAPVSARPGCIATRHCRVVRDVTVRQSLLTCLARGPDSEEMSVDCAVCGKTEPNDGCWEARMDCPFGKPPRHLDVHDLWGWIVKQEKRIRALENVSPKRDGAKLTAATLTERTIRSALWKLNRSVQKPFYSWVSRRVDDDTLFSNWGYEEDPPMDLPLDAEDEPNRYPIGLYHATATQRGDLTGKRVLEVGCGHGGGASYLVRTLRPASYVGLDLNASGIEFCRRRHQLPGLEFVAGNAEDLPFASQSFDALINVESSGCYPHFDRFLSEVERVLRPEGTFLYTDARLSYQCDRWEADLGSVPGMRIVSGREINIEVLRGMELNSARWATVMDSLLPGFLRRVARSMGPLQGSALYRDVQTGAYSYRMYSLTKAA